MDKLVRRFFLLAAIGLSAALNAQAQVPAGVGIGTNAPQATLHVAGAPATTLSTAGATITASSVQGTSPAANALDGNPNTFWASGSGLPQWLQLDFGQSRRVNSYNLTGAQLGILNTTRPRDWTLAGSHDGSTWTTLSTVTNAPNTTAAIPTSLAQTAEYRYYRLTVNRVQGSDPTTAVFLAEWQLGATPLGLWAEGDARLSRLAGPGTRLVATDANGNLTATDALPAGVTGDDLGNHTATQNLNLADKQLVGNGGSQGLRIDNSGNVGLGVTPQGRLDLWGGNLLLGGAISNAEARPAIGTGRIAGEISAYGRAAGTTPTLAADDGLLRLSAGGGSNAATKSFIDLAGASTQADADRTLVLGTAGQERLRITANGYLGLGLTQPDAPLHLRATVPRAVVAESNHATGTWLGLDNTSTGALGWQMVATGASSPAGAGKLLLGPGRGSTVSSTPLAVDGNTGRVGVNTTAPNSTLHVNGTTAVAVSVPIVGLPPGPGSRLSLAGVNATFLILAPTRDSFLNDLNSYELPDPISCPGRLYYLRNTGSISATVFSAGDSRGRVFYNTPTANAYMLPAGNFIMVISDGAMWHVGVL